MSQTRITSQSRRTLHVALALILFICLWAGWSDFDVQMSQNEVREGIRSTIRQLIQFSIQFAIPAAIIAFFVKEIIRWFRSRDV